MYGSWDNDFDMGPGGNGVTWDLTEGIVTSAPYTSQVFQASLGPGGSNFPGAGTALSSGADAEYFLLNNSQYALYGAYQYEIVVYYDDPEVLCEFPMSFGSSTVDDFSSSFFSSEAYEREGSVTCTYDGYGTLITPLGTLENVYRLKIEEDYTDTPGNPDDAINYVSENYQFFKDGVDGLIASITNVTYWSFTSSSIVYRTDISTHTTEYADHGNLKFYPNPADDILYLDGLSQSGQSELLVYSLAGTLVQRELVNNGRVDIASLSPGIYLLEIRNDDQVKKEKLVVQ